MVLRAVSAAGEGVHAAAHITGGGIVQNLSRAIPDHCDAVVDTSKFTVPSIFSEIQRLGRVDDNEMERVFNLGIGMILVVVRDVVDRAIAAIEGAGCKAGVIGRVDAGTGRVHLER
jgi:phosphoribosylformylglycinamidine cyclo-ligase